MALNSSLISTTGTVIFQAAGDVAITTIIFCNTDVVTSSDITVYAVGNGGTTDLSNMILNTLTLPATETFVLDAEKFILGAGDQFVATSTAHQIVAATVSSVTI